MKLTQYQRQLVEQNGKQILIGARQSGKTETVVQKAKQAFEDNQDVLVLAPSHQMVMQVSERTRELLDGEITRRDEIESRTSPLNSILFRRNHACRSNQFKKELEDADVVLVDEANCVDKKTLFVVEKEHGGDVLLTATPAPENSVVEIWAKHSPYWRTTQVPADDVPFLQDNHLKEFRDGLDLGRELREVDAEIL